MLLALGAAGIRVRAAADAYRIDKTKSTVTIEIGKSGALSFVAGHTHEVTGPIASGAVDVDRRAPSHAHIKLVIPAAGLKLSRRSESAEDAQKIQETMDGEGVLASDRYRELTFESTSVKASGQPADAMDLVVDGRLTIRGVTQPVSAPVHVAFNGDALTATGRFTVKQSAFGIKPVTVGGVVAVKDALDIRFSIVGSR